MLHAFRNPIAVHLMDSYRMYVGPATTSALLEVAVSDDGVIFHAMPARPKYLPR